MGTARGFMGELCFGTLLTCVWWVLSCGTVWCFPGKKKESKIFLPPLHPSNLPMCWLSI